jgi:hypothetical protein
MRQDLPAIQKAYDVAKELFQRVGNFPKEYRYNLGDRIIESVLGVLENLTVAAYSSRKGELLDEASLKLDRLRILVRLSRELGPVSNKGYEHIAVMTDDLGRQIGGWRKQTGGKHAQNLKEPVPGDN